MVVGLVLVVSGGWEAFTVGGVWGSGQSSIEGIVGGIELPTSVMLLVVRCCELGEKKDKIVGGQEVDAPKIR